MEVDLGMRSQAQIWGAKPLCFLDAVRSSAGVGVCSAECFGLFSFPP